MRTRRECTHKAHKSSRDLIYTYNNLDENTLAPRRDLCYTMNVHTISTSIMYDDYDLDYTFTNDHTDLDEYYTSDLDEDYARDAHDYESLAYRHYA